jgi:hydrogenase nickel incorporation protein HypA/HybF
MHEASLMADLMRRIEEIARSERARRVVRVCVRIGALSHMSAEHFADHFNHAGHGTLAENAQLGITVSNDTQDMHAQDIVLESVEVET